MVLSQFSRVLLACLLVLPLVIAAGAGPARAADTLGLGIERLKSARAATHVEAGELEYLEGQKIAIGRRDVIIQFGDRTLHADEVWVNMETQDFVATGNVLLVEGPNRLEGERLEFNYGTSLGVMYNARGFFFPNTNFRGLEVRKAGEREYRILRGAYTSCRVCLSETDPRSWEMRAEEATFIQDEVFTAKHATVWLADSIPVFYFPTVSVPLGPRRSGFLIPRVGYGDKSGFTYRQPFYWAISESQDATIQGIFRSRRGFEIGASHQYILSPRASGQWSGTYLRDREKDLAGRDRWEIHGQHDQHFTPTLSLKADINFQSDSSLGRDFADRSLVERTARTIQTNVFVTQAAEAYNAMLRTDVNRDLTNTQDTRLIRAPELRFHLFDRSVFSLPVTAGGLGSATFFERRTLPAAVRVDFAPRFRVPWAPTPWLSVMATAGFRETAYSEGNEGFSGAATRTLADVGGSAEARFVRVFDVGGRELSQIVHVVAPQVGYQFVPFVDQQRFPQFDGEDFVSPQNHFTYGLESRFVARFRQDGGQTTSREVLRLGAVQAFNFRPRTRVFSDHYLTALGPERVDNAVTNPRQLLDRGGQPSGFLRADERQFTNLVFSLQSNPHPLIFFRGSLAYNTAAAADEATNLQVRLQYPAWGSLGLGYTRVGQQGLEAYLANIGLTLTPELSLGYSTRFDARQRTFLEHNTVLRYATCCWEVGVHWINRERAGLPNENDVRLVFDLKTGRGSLAPPRGAPAGGMPSPPATGAAAGGPIPGAAAPPAGLPEPGPHGRPVDGPATGR